MKRTFIRTGFIILWLVIFNEGLPAETETYLVEAYRLNIRKCASADCEVLGFVSKNDTIPIESINGDWAKVVFPNGLTGYISAKHITKIHLNEAGEFELEKSGDDIIWIKIDPWVWLKYSIIPFFLFFPGVLFTGYFRLKKQIKNA